VSEEEWITCRTSDLKQVIANAIAPLFTENETVKTICQQALDVARDRSNVLEVVWAQNWLAREALKRLLDDNEHAKHSCGDPIDECPVAFARYVLRGPVKQ